MSVPTQPGLEASIGSLTQNTPNGAQSPNPSPAAFAVGATGERIFTEAELNATLAKVRKEEKDKLYPELTSVKEQLAAILKQREEEAANIARIQQEKEAALQAKKEEEMSAKALLEAKLRETNDTWEQRFNSLQAEREQEKALADKERAYNQLVDYRNGRLAELADDIAPQFHSFISGNTIEQIDAAIEQARSATQSIYDQVAQAQQRPAPTGVRPTGYSAFGPLDNAAGTKTYSAEEINSMSMAEFEEFRRTTGMTTRDANRNRGLFG